MSNFNPVALLVIALFTALAALTAPGAWLVGLVIGLGTVIVASFTGLRNDLPVLLIGLVVLLLVIL